MKDLKNKKETSIQEALTEIDAEFIDESAPDASASAGKTEKKGRTLLYVLIAAAVVLLLIAGTVTTVLHLREKPPAGSDIPLSGAETENSAARAALFFDAPAARMSLPVPARRGIVSLIRDTVDREQGDNE